MIKLKVPFYENNFLIWYRSKICTFTEKQFIKTKPRSGYVSGIGSTICLKSLAFLAPNDCHQEDRKLMKDRQHNDQAKKYKRSNNDLRNIHIKFLFLFCFYFAFVCYFFYFIFIFFAFFVVCFMLYLFCVLFFVIFW